MIQGDKLTMRYLYKALANNKSCVVRLRESYGTPRYSQGFEELLVRHFFGDSRGGVFVDVGANHYRRNSTTYYLERHLGWCGLAIDALSRFKGGYIRYRPRTRFVPAFVSDRCGRQVSFYVDLMSSSGVPDKC